MIDFVSKHRFKYIRNVNTTLVLPIMDVQCYSYVVFNAKY